MTSIGTENRSHVEGEMRRLSKISQRTLYEKIVYNLDVLVPEDEDSEIFVPRDSYIQQVHYGHVRRWRIQRNAYRNLPEYLTDHRELDSTYRVITESKGFFTPLDLGSPFLKKWDSLSLLLLIYTASVTPWETAFMPSSLEIGILFLVGAAVDLVFFTDIIVQMRTPYRDVQTGKLVRDVSQISLRYWKGWGPIDLISVLPFDLLGFLASGDSTDLGQLRLLRFMRLTRLLKLLRVFRASRKLRQWQIHSGLRFGTIQSIKFVVVIVFLMHWLACGYRLASERISPTDPPGWVEYHNKYTNKTSDVWEIYLLSLYWSASTISLMGCNYAPMIPTNIAEWAYTVFANVVAYMLTVVIIATTSSYMNLTSSTKLEQDILIDNYLEIFDTLKLDQRLKFKVFEHLTDHFVAQANQKQTQMLRNLPVTLHGFIALEMFLPFIEQIPYLEPFIDRDPQMIQDICRLVEIRTCAPNNLVFNEGYEGIYYVDIGIISVEGKIYSSGTVFGRTILRDNNKKREGRALTDVQYYLLPRKEFSQLMLKYPKVRYYAKRWTAWELLREYILAYSRLYFTAAKRGAKLSPPLLSRRPNMVEGELDDIDIAVLDHLNDTGY